MKNNKIKVERYDLINRLRNVGYKCGTMHYRFVKRTRDSEPELLHVHQDNKKEFAEILSNGGRTNLRLTFPDGSEMIEECYCSYRDTYNPSLGIRIAFGRMIKKRREMGKNDKY